jgi:hypothetical protein
MSDTLPRDRAPYSAIDRAPLTSFDRASDQAALPDALNEGAAA